MRRLQKIFLLSVLFFTPSFAFTKQYQGQEIVFKKGRTSTVVKGSLKNVQDRVVYKFRAKAAQKLVVQVMGFRVVLYSPSGEAIGGGPGGDEIEALPENGEYRIEVTVDTMAEFVPSSFELKLKIL